MVGAATPGVLLLGLTAWTRLHGITSLEIEGVFSQMNIRQPPLQRRGWTVPSRAPRACATRPGCRGPSPAPISSDGPRNILAFGGLLMLGGRLVDG